MKKAYIKKPFQIETCQEDIPAIREDQVLVKVVCAGICGSDSQTYHGKHKTRNVFPIDFGHEAAGIVVKCGAQVKGLAPGDRVTVEPQQYCGHCFPCRIGRFNVCENLKVTSIFFREYAAADAYTLHRCPGDMPFERIALAEPLAVAVGSVSRCDVKGMRVCVVGAGTIGNLIAQMAVREGAKDVLITDVLDKKLDYARLCGIPHCANVRETALRNTILSAFGPDMADIIIDAAATAQGFADIMEAARPRSSVVITGNYKEPVSFDVTKIQRQEISLLGHMMYVREHYERAIQLLYRNELYLEGFISQRFDLDHMQEALEYIDQHPGDVMKVMIHISDEVQG